MSTFDNYTPTTEEVRRRWAAAEFADEVGPGDWAYEHADFAPLDRWLAGVIRQAKRDGWEEGADAGVAHALDQPLTPPVNPHADE